MSAKISINQKV